MAFPLDKNSEGFIERHFKRKQFRWDENFLLEVLEHPRSKHDVYWAAIGLRKVGTARSVEPLRALLTFPMQDVKCVAILTIAHVAREKATPILSHALLGPIYREKPSPPSWSISRKKQVEIEARQADEWDFRRRSPVSFKACGKSRGRPVLP